MSIYDIITKKKQGLALTKEEIFFFVNGVTGKNILSEQASALMMAVCLKGMTDEETFFLTEAMANSGEILDLSSLGGITADKHSTGGVGDKTTLIVGPVIASFGVYFAKMSGRGLGHTGGTIDKLEAIEGFNANIAGKEFVKIAKKTGIIVVGQNEKLVPADKILYAIRDTTATVDSIPLIASSIMSKKIASGAKCILLDVKYGNGAFMKTKNQGRKLAALLEKTGEYFGRNTRAILSPQNQPLGYAVGNSLEVIEAIETLKGKGPGDLTRECLTICANILNLAGMGSVGEMRKTAAKALKDGSAFYKFCEMVKAQEGNEDLIQNTSLFKRAKYVIPFYAEKSGKVIKVNALNIGLASCAAGAGRAKKDDIIDPYAGIILLKKEGDCIKKGEPLLYIHTSDETRKKQAFSYLSGGILIE